MAKIYFANNKLDLEFFLNSVAEVILQNNASLFCGAGSSIQYGAISWDSLINNLASEFNVGSNTDTAQYANIKGENIKEKISKAMELFKIDGSEKDTYLNYCLNFDFKSIWTTNYDNVIETVLKQKSKKYKPIFQYAHFQNISYLDSGHLYKINGSYEKPQTIIITKEDFINYRNSHEAYLILLKRELLYSNFLFIGCSFDDDILRICIKDILRCLENNSDNYYTKHYAIIAEKNQSKLEFITKDLSKYYEVNCLAVNNPKKSYEIAKGLSNKIKYSSIFVSGAKIFERHSNEEYIGKNVCRNIVKSFAKFDNFPFKFITGLGISIGHFIAGAIKNHYGNSNINRYLLIDPFPFSSKEENDFHRKCMLNKAGIFLFIFGDYDENQLSSSGMWKEYIIATLNPENIIVALPCGSDSISSIIYNQEKSKMGSFSNLHLDLLEQYNFMTADYTFYDELVKKVVLATRINMDTILDSIVNSLREI